MVALPCGKCTEGEGEFVSRHELLQMFRMHISLENVPARECRQNEEPECGVDGHEEAVYPDCGGHEPCKVANAVRGAHRHPQKRPRAAECECMCVRDIG
jgi:hypothetical protein